MSHTQELINGFNKAHQTAVAINCDHIGDDNDYSCFLYITCMKMFLAGLKDEALKLWNTDPMLLRVATMEELQERVNDYQNPKF